MFKSGTVVVLGAGASFEVGLPTGHELKDSISALTRFKFEHGDFVSGDRSFFSELRRSDHFATGRQIDLITKACKKISDGIGFVSSVDNFLEIHAKDADIQVCAKAAITYLIAKGERASRLYVDPSNIHNRLSAASLKDTWYQELAHILFEKVDGESIAKAFDSVRFVSYNYDRCLEWFLYQSLTGLYAMDTNQASEILEGVSILHPYGDIGAPEWQRSPADFFGSDISGSVVHASKRLLTYNEGGAPEVACEVRAAVESATTIVFLGFAFHPQNVELMRSQRKGKFSKVENIFGTSFKLSENDNHEVTTQLGRAFGAPSGNVKLANMTCCEFLRRYKRTLSA